MRADGRHHDCMGIHRSSEQVSALQEAVLIAWAAGSEGAAIAAVNAVARSYVEKIVQRARRAGDIRAIRRPRFVLPPGGGRRAA